METSYKTLCGSNQTVLIVDLEMILARKSDPRLTPILILEEMGCAKIWLKIKLFI